ncbi:hypothetical protein HPB50_007273 [Hyalomma asiaticum]|uniref:Uncharacterized protein n=1 Tax=Hyalomma asiaticum TaxID=266040 RepID=A0ACB7RLJ1_HYAAI|nr:hypothetical protein HPB50_007273 [Hyalomma asiaticum]
MPNVPLWAIPAGSATAECLTAAGHGDGEVADVRCLRRPRQAVRRWRLPPLRPSRQRQAPARNEEAGTATAAAPPANSCRALALPGALFTAARHAAARALLALPFAVCFL